MTETTENEPKRVLTNIRPDKVSLVDLGANNEMFFVAKGFKPVKKDAESTSSVVDAVSLHLEGIASRATTLTNWLKDAPVDSENGVVPQQVTNIIKWIRDSVVDLKLAFEVESMDGVLVPGDVRDKMVTMLEVVTQKILAAKDGVSKSEDGGPTEDFIKSLDDVVSSIDLIGDSYENLTVQENARKILADHTETENSEESEDTMSEKIAVLMKSVEKIDLDMEYVEKQLGSATAKLTELMNSLNMSTDFTDEDYWDIRWKVSEAVGLLVEAAKLEKIIGGGGVEKSAEGEGTEMTEKNTDQKPAGEETETSKSSPESKTEETPVAKTESTPESSIEKPVAKADDVPATNPLVDAIGKAIAGAMAPLSEQLAKLTDKVISQDAEIEKLATQRAAAKGGESEQSGTRVEKGASDKSKSLFTAIMPNELTGVYAHGERVDE